MSKEAHKELLPGGIFGRLSALDEPLPHSIKRWWWCWGSLPGFFFAIQVVTGILLAFYYEASPEGAYESVRFVTEEARYGWFVRSVHMWSANLMILFVFLHATRVLVTGGYRGRGRWATWMAGVAMLLATLLLAFTGYTLIYEQLSYWGITVAANINSYVPVIGEPLADFMRYGDEVNDHTLSRMYALHTFLLPPSLVLLTALHIYLIRRFGVHVPGSEADVAAEAAQQKKEGPYHFFPAHAMAELVVFLYLALVLVLLSIGFPAEMREPANPLVTPEHIQPEWYFYATFRWLKLFPGQVGVLLLAALGGVAFFWPFVDRGLRRLAPKAELAMWIGVAAVIVMVSLTVLEAL
ncbi:MAG: cytochrome bc complex cytochrome b subunit [Myxococcales bacterium]|nr:cytochrome bc complex cytochrome b subunit [Myxococcales bacterium]